ncbi:MAG: nodulation protein NfeD [Cohnella sp.]|nr:nodulation protein NfeD [Cohnella sp.]
MVRVRKKLALIIGLIPLLAALFVTIVPLNAANAESRAAGAVYVIPVKMTVESGLASFLDRALTEAEDARASLVVLDFDTPGGRLDTAEKIGKRIRETTAPTVAFVSGKAASAGAYLALNAGDIAMAPATTIGAAMIVDQNGNAVDNPKYVSFWSQEMAGAAELNGRNSDIAVKMVDPSRELTVPELGETYKAGTILSLSAEKALKVGYADTIAKSVEEVIAWKGLQDRPVIEVKLTLSEHVSEFLTSPGITALLLIVGIAGVAIELLVPGFGVPGIVGVVAFGLYFFGQFVAGFAGMEAVVLFVIGLILLVSELFIPSFGILGILGIAAVISGITMGAKDTGDALSTLGLSALIALVIIAVFVYIFRKRGVWNRFILREALTTEQGYVPNNPRESWIGREGVTQSELRPSGIAEIEGERVDVITGGEFVERGRHVRIVAVDGTRVVVQEVKRDSTNSL